MSADRCAQSAHTMKSARFWSGRSSGDALAMDYPEFPRLHARRPSRRDWLKALCAELGCQAHLSRLDNAHAKAGNINHALKHIAALPDPPEFISILDADFVPTPRFLTRAMSKLFRDPAIPESCRRRNISSTPIPFKSILARPNSGLTNSAISLTSSCQPRTPGPPHSVAAHPRSSACSL